MSAAATEFRFDFYLGELVGDLWGIGVFAGLLL